MESKSTSGYLDAESAAGASLEEPANPAKSTIVWRTSSASGSHAGNCIQPGSSNQEFVGIRDSKNHDVIDFAAAAVTSFVVYAKAADGA